MSEITPLMAQYQSIKADYPNEVLFFRLGDFYEMFNDDAIEVSRLLNLTLTHRADSPMCGIPYHASKVYIARLLRSGKKIAICEQIGEVSHGKGLTERKVIEVITPGTALEEEYLEQSVNNYLGALCPVKNGRELYTAFSVIDVSTGTFQATSWLNTKDSILLPRELGRIQVRELLICQDMADNPVVKQIISLNPQISVSWYPAWNFSYELSLKRLLAQFGTTNLRSFNLYDNSPEIVPAGFLLDYLIRTSNTMRTSQNFPQINNIRVYNDSQFVIIDDSSRRNLEIMANLNDGSSKFTLFESLNYTLTPMGNRLLRTYLSTPLLDLKLIQKRQENISVLKNSTSQLDKLRDYLSTILDIERLATRIAMDKAHAKDIQALKQSLISFLKVRSITDKFDFSNTDTAIAEQVIKLIQEAILDDPSTSLTEGRLIKPQWSEELDHWKEVHDNFNSILDNYLEEEKQNTGIQNLKIRYNRNIGYYIEVTKGKLDFVPSHFILRRALVNGDRYTTEKLQELERELLTAGEKIIELEKTLFLEIIKKLSQHTQYFMQIAKEIAYTDFCASLAKAAIINNWVCPDVDDSSALEIIKGRHPVVEMHLPSGEFVPNDSNLTQKKFALITGPNMAGKSTYLRQNALIVLMAQIGSFVPAQKAHIGICDAIFCRVGASDNLARGESTFLVEMTETAHILRSATEKSLVIMDEVGRGTSTEDGLSIAWAVSEFLLNSIRAKTFFATHYHELTRLTHHSLIQLYLDVLDSEGEVVFLRKIKEGVSENSYGIHVAKLAGIPNSVIERANEVLCTLQKNTPFTNSQIENLETKTQQNDAASVITPSVRLPGLFSDEEMILDDILSTDIDSITPLEALQLIFRWKKTLSGK